MNFLRKLFHRREKLCEWACCCNCTAGRSKDKCCEKCSFYHWVDSGCGWCRALPQPVSVPWCKDVCGFYRVK